jgi:uncharacterized membrane protein YhaH (DUF805 family)
VIVARWLRLWLTLRDPVEPREYLWSGVGLMAFKYAVDAGVVWLVLHRVWTPLNYFIPSLVWREATLRVVPTWLVLALALWSLPFMWIGVTMTLRRAVDAGRSPWVCFLFFLPVVNYGVMLWLAFEPTRAAEAWNAREPEASEHGWLRSAVLSIITGCVAAAALLLFCLFVIRPYGIGLFLGVPFLLGAVTAFRFNRDEWREVAQTTHVVLGAVFVVGGAIVLFAIEGVVCLAMALPFAVPLAALGGLLGRAIALRAPSPATHAWLLLLALPGLAGLQAGPEPPALREGSPSSRSTRRPRACGSTWSPSVISPSHRAGSSDWASPIRSARASRAGAWVRCAAASSPRAPSSSPSPCGRRPLGSPSTWPPSRRRWPSGARTGASGRPRTMPTSVPIAASSA